MPYKLTVASRNIYMNNQLAKFTVKDVLWSTFESSLRYHRK